MTPARFRTVIAGAALVLAFSMLGSGQDAEKSRRDMNERGAKAMGFDQAKAVHHFYLLKNGGAIELSAKNPEDKPTVDAIQQHLAAQAKLFEKGNFDAPEETHGKTPDGVSTLRKLRKEITFEVVPMDSGAALRMLTVNSQARTAIQDFLKFQIQEHQTGDPMEIQ